MGPQEHICRFRVGLGLTVHRGAWLHAWLVQTLSADRTLTRLQVAFPGLLPGNSGDGEYCLQIWGCMGLCPIMEGFGGGGWQ